VLETGAETGLLVIDVDTKGGVDGYAQLEELEEQLGDLPETLEVLTGSGGLHLYFRHPGGVRLNGKLSTAIDLKGDKATDEGLVYVVGPGSPGYVKTEDPCVVRPSSQGYAICEDHPLADLPEKWLAYMKSRSSARSEAFRPIPVDVDTEEGRRRVALGIAAAKTMAPSRADGEAGRNLFALSLHLVRRLELPVPDALDIVREHFNPRCTDPQGRPFPWADEDILHKLEDARDKSEAPCGTLSQATLEGYKELAERRANPNRTPIAPPPAPEGQRNKVGAGQVNDGERVKLTRAGVTQMLYNWPDWDGVFWFDVLAQKPHATNPPLLGKLTLEDGEKSRGDYAQIALWFDVMGFSVSKDLIEDAVDAVCAMPDRKRNLIAEYFDGIPQATDAKVLPTLATDLLGCKDHFDNVLVMKTLVAAARRARQPGSFHKAMLVLKGEQQCGKTPFVKILAGPWYQTTGNGNLAERDTILECQGKLLVEVEELSALNKADADGLKTAISRTHDPITKKYEPDARTYPRSFTLIGTTNKSEFLTDETGNARYWVVEVGDIDMKRLAELRDVIWAEADFLARQGMSNELDKAEVDTLNSRNASYLNTHPWLGEVEAYLRGKKEVASASEVLSHILKGDMTKATQRDKNAVAGLMRTLGCQDLRTTRDGKTVRFWRVPDTIGDVAPREATVTRLRPLRSQ